MSKNIGKVFEQKLRQQFESLVNVSVDRINDNVGYSGAYNIADLIVYRKPYKYYLECKVRKGTNFAFDGINEEALMDMQHQCLIKGVACYFIIWFTDLDLTIAIHCNEIYEKMYVSGKKSIGTSSFKDFNFIVVNGKKKQKYFNYNLSELLDKFDGELSWQN